MEGSLIYVNKLKVQTLLCLIQAWILFHFVYSLQSGVCQRLSKHVLGFQTLQKFF